MSNYCNTTNQPAHLLTSISSCVTHHFYPFLTAIILLLVSYEIKGMCLFTSETTLYYIMLQNEWLNIISSNCKTLTRIQGVVSSWALTIDTVYYRMVSNDNMYVYN